MNLRFGVDESGDRRANLQGRASDFQNAVAHHDIMNGLNELATTVPIEHRFDPYVQNGGSVLGIRPVLHF